jgi:chemotaxis protein CheD
LSDVVNVGLAELKVTNGDGTLASFGLGSCVAVAMFDPVRRVGGLAHVMLPESRGRDSELTPGKFADTAIDTLAKELVRAGARQKSLICKIAGGSQMFQIITAPSRAVPACPSSTHIGDRNIEAVKVALDVLGIPLVGEDTGGNYGRTVRFDVASGQVEISSISHGKVVI